MNIELEPGTYVVAVSGGVDSMVLLDVLARQYSLHSTKPSSHKVKLLVAHLDHGMRDDSVVDRKLVQHIAEKHGLPFVYRTATLGQGASEAEARQVRYQFLKSVQAASNARAIITAHHQDDLLETAVHNLLRGTGRKGLTSLQDSKNIKRPLLAYTKQQLRKYAQEHHVDWHEDVTNADTSYTRNYIRHVILPKLTSSQKQQLLQLIDNTGTINRRLDAELSQLMKQQNTQEGLVRQQFINLPHAVSREVMADWLRLNGIRQFNRKLLEQLVNAAKTYKPGKHIDVNNDFILRVEKDRLLLHPRNS